MSEDIYIKPTPSIARLKKLPKKLEWLNWHGFIEQNIGTIGLNPINLILPTCGCLGLQLHKALGSPVDRDYSDRRKVWNFKAGFNLLHNALYASSSTYKQWHEDKGLGYNGTNPGTGDYIVRQVSLLNMRWEETGCLRINQFIEEHNLRENDGRDPDWIFNQGISSTHIWFERGELMRLFNSLLRKAGIN